MKINKTTKKIVMILALVVALNISICFAKTNEYKISDEYNFLVSKNIPQNAYVMIFVGNSNVAQYSKGSIDARPFPNEILEDEHGNKILKYNYLTLEEYKGKIFSVSLIKNINTTDNKIVKDKFVDSQVLSRYLKNTPKIESNNPYIQTTAETITKECTNDYEKAKKIFEYVNMYLTYDTSEVYRNKGALSAMLTGRGVCEEYATLYCALCRASGISARVMTGYNAEKLELGVKTDAVSSYHAWPEIYMEDTGWTPLEITAEYYKNGVKAVYWDGFLQLPDQTKYVVEGIYNDAVDENGKVEVNEIEWFGVSLKDYDKSITLVKEIYFNDVNEHWAKKNIENLYNKKIINGYEDGTFLPDNNVTRAEYITMLSRMVEYLNYNYYDIEDIYYTGDFQDSWVKENYDKLMKYYAFYAQDTENGAGYKTISYVFGDNFDMDKPILREEVVALLAPFLRYTEEEEVSLTDINESKFKKEIVVSYMNDIIIGYEDNTFKPTNTITRAEIATIFDRMTSKEN